MKKIILVLITALFFTGCAAVNTFGDLVNDNELWASALTRHAVSRYIAAGDTIDAEERRAKQVETRLSRVLEYIEGNPSATSGDLMALVESTIDWGELDRADKLLVQDILAILEKELEQYETREGLKESTRIALRGLFDTAISAARIYLERG